MFEHDYCKLETVTLLIGAELKTLSLHNSHDVTSLTLVILEYEELNLLNSVVIKIWKKVSNILSKPEGFSNLYTGIKENYI